jgi:hypothetical protein
MEVIGNVAKLDHPGHVEKISACCEHVNVRLCVHRLDEERQRSQARARSGDSSLASDDA